MSKYTLRPYQEKQIEFIEDRINLTDVIGLESATGSGKSITIMEFVKRWLSKPENQLSNVIITTGFNNLVFDLEKRAKEFGLNPKVLIGTRACNCPKEMEEAGFEPKVFTETDQFICKDKHKHLDITTNNWKLKTCPYTRDFYMEYYNDITSNVGQVIIMNHSSLLVHQQHLQNVSLVIVDEAHTFTTFYDSYVRLELDKDDLINMDEAIKKIKPPMNKIIEMNIKNNRPLPSVQIDKICDNIEESGLRSRVREFFETKPSLQNYIETTPNSFTIDKFYRCFEFDFSPKFVLFSATLDKFTRMMFNCSSSYYYREMKQFCDYSKSEFIAMPDEDFEKAFLRFLDYVDGKSFERGLCLSTTINDVKLALKHDNYRDFKMFEDIQEFQEYEGKKILVGSRRLFQGVDIHDLQFVCLNKIPFPNWNEKTQAMRDYITNQGKNDIDFWNDFSVPRTENDIIQGTGRLWRSPDSFGIVSIFDPRIIKHKYMIRHVMNTYRYGIKNNIMYEDGTIEEFDVSKLEDLDKRQDRDKEEILV